ncbi:hypothetical protein GALL_468050 [mine drainage metagenome]|uniref:Uncharacterized protein n=1 Tax=mine drainage metagenome TaxID=410659 RepID=A0A1J5PUY9_9ZZZZ
MTSTVTPLHGIKDNHIRGRTHHTRVNPDIRSHKTDRFKRWLAQVGYERVKEIETPSWPAPAPVSCTRSKAGTRVLPPKRESD